MANTPPGRIPALSSLRFLAALAVIAHHTAGFRPGYGGVSLFFVLSGFVLARSSRPVTIGDTLRFWQARARRIMPMHLACLVLALPLGFSGVGALLANAFLLQSWSSDASVYFGLNAVAWSLSVEAFFYLLFPAIARLGWREAGAATAAVFMVAVGAQIAEIDAAAVHAAFYINPLARLPEFLTGIALANAGVHRCSGRTVSATWFITMAGVWILPAAPATQALVFLPASALTIAYASNQRDGWLTSRALVMNGEASFTLYMIAQLSQRYAVVALGSSRVVAIGSVSIAIGTALLWRRRDAFVAAPTPRHSRSP